MATSATEDNLADAFGTPATELGKLLPRRTSAPSAPVDAPPAEEEALAHAPAPTPIEAGPAITVRSSRSVAKTLKRSQPTGTGDLTRPVPIYLLPEVIAALRNETRTQRVTNAQLALEALDQLHNDLGRLISLRRTGPVQDGSLFPPRMVRSRRLQGSDERRRLWTFQATDRELEVIDRLMRSASAESRSELVATALEHVYRG